VSVEGEPMDGVRISLTDEAAEVAYSRSETDGTYRIACVRPEPGHSLRVRAVSPERTFDPAFHELGALIVATQEMNFVELATEFLSGSVRRSDGTPVPRCVVRVYDEATEEIVTMAETDEGGLFTVRLSPKSYRVEAEAGTEGLRFSPVHASLTPGRGYDPVNLVAEAGARIAGRVVFADGSPRPEGGGVVLIRSSDLSVVGNLTLVSDDGSYAFGGLEPGAYTLRYLSGNDSAKTNIVLTKDVGFLNVHLHIGRSSP